MRQTGALLQNIRKAGGSPLMVSDRKYQNSVKKLELFLSSTIKAIPSKSFWKKGSGEDAFFQKGIFPGKPSCGSSFRFQPLISGDGPVFPAGGDAAAEPGGGDGAAAAEALSAPGSRFWSPRSSSGRE